MAIALMVVGLVPAPPAAAQQYVDLASDSQAPRYHSWYKNWLSRIDLEAVEYTKRRAAGLMSCDNCYFETGAFVRELQGKKFAFCIYEGKLHLRAEGTASTNDYMVLKRNGRIIAPRGKVRDMVYSDIGKLDWKVYIPVTKTVGARSVTLQLGSTFSKTSGMRFELGQALQRELRGALRGYNAIKVGIGRNSGRSVDRKFMSSPAC
ncbi:hypothetical protein [Alteriqipengyuania sp.]|uniref:hypothetical protein n=1 Tax=Alteriqipengyuania sp. TaxID=2800692 RepID=UPI003512A3A5